MNNSRSTLDSEVMAAEPSKKDSAELSVYKWHQRLRSKLKIVWNKVIKLFRINRALALVLLAGFVALVFFIVRKIYRLVVPADDIKAAQTAA
jgi:hypothetical protein